MKLIQVIYELYGSDAAYLEDHRDDDMHPLDREIRLCFEDHQSIWVAWSSKPLQFCVNYQDQPNFIGKIDILADMTDSSIWRGLINNEISLNYIEPDQYLLEISSEKASVWCWVEGEFGSDVLHISSNAPTPNT